MTIIETMRTLDPLETDKVESWLDRVELFLMELQATERAQVILDLNQQILAQAIASSELRVEDILKKMGEPIQVANRLRSERGLKPRPRLDRPRSLSRVLLFSVLACLVFMTTCTFSLPFVIPWGINHLALKLGQQPEGFQSFRFFGNTIQGSNSNEKSDNDSDNDSDKETRSDAENEESEGSEPNLGLPAEPSDTQKGAGGITQENIKGSFQSEGATH